MRVIAIMCLVTLVTACEVNWMPACTTDCSQAASEDISATLEGALP